MRRPLLVAVLAVLAMLASPAGAQDAPPPLRLRLNIPAYRLEVIEGATTHRYKVAVGTRRYRTPIGSFGINQVVWNPNWIPPESDWARNERPQPPGPDNNMGRVKMRFTGLVFIHGSPFVHSLGTAASHACVRMANEDAIAVARLVQRHALPEVPADLVDSLVADEHRTRTFTIGDPVPLEVRYELAEVEGDSVYVYPNVYDRRADAHAQAMNAMWAAGVDTTLVDRDRLAQLVKAGRKRRTAAAVLQLIAGP